METNFDNYRFQVESGGETHSFEWDSYPVDLVGVLSEELEDRITYDGDMTYYILASLCPAVSFAIRFTSKVADTIKDGASAPVTVRLIGTDDGAVHYTETLDMSREGNQLTINDWEVHRANDMAGALAKVDAKFPTHEQFQDEFERVSEADRKWLLQGVVAATLAVKDQLDV